MRIVCAILFVFTCFTLYGHPGMGIVEDSKGNVYYTDLKQVWKISPSGRKAIVVPNVHTHELYIDDGDFIFGEHLWYSGNTWGHYVWRLSPSGTVEKVIPNTEGFLENYSFVRDHLGNMYWADRSNDCQAVVRRGKDQVNKVITDECFKNIRKVEVLPDGTVFLTDFQDLKKIDPNGTVKTVASRIANKHWSESNIQNQNSVMGIWADPAGNLYAAILSEGLVKKFGPDGKEAIVYKTGLLWSPSGGMIDSQGNLWVLEVSRTNAVRVERVDKSGKVSAY